MQYTHRKLSSGWAEGQTKINLLDKACRLPIPHYRSQAALSLSHPSARLLITAGACCCDARRRASQAASKHWQISPGQPVSQSVSEALQLFSSPGDKCCRGRELSIPGPNKRGGGAALAARTLLGERKQVGSEGGATCGAIGFHQLSRGTHASAQDAATSFHQSARHERAFAAHAAAAAVVYGLARRWHAGYSASVCRGRAYRRERGRPTGDGWPGARGCSAALAARGILIW